MTKMRMIQIAVLFTLAVIIGAGYQNCSGYQNTMGSKSDRNSDAGYGGEQGGTMPPSGPNWQTSPHMPNSTNRQSVSAHPKQNIGIDSFYDDDNGHSLCESQNDGLGRPCCCVANGVEPGTGRPLIKRRCDLDSEANKQQCLNWRWPCARFNNGGDRYFDRTQAGFTECRTYPTGVDGSPAFDPPCNRHCCYSKFLKYRCYKDNDEWWQDESRQRRCLREDGTPENPSGPVEGCIIPRPSASPSAAPNPNPPDGYGPRDDRLDPEGRNREI